jgi:hypothetical protein
MNPTSPQEPAEDWQTCQTHAVNLLDHLKSPAAPDHPFVIRRIMATRRCDAYWDMSAIRDVTLRDINDGDTDRMNRITSRGILTEIDHVVVASVSQTYKTLYTRELRKSLGWSNWAEHRFAMSPLDSCRSIAVGAVLGFGTGFGCLVLGSPAGPATAAAATASAITTHRRLQHRAAPFAMSPLDSCRTIAVAAVLGIGTGYACFCFGFSVGESVVASATASAIATHRRSQHRAARKG